MRFVYLCLVLLLPALLQAQEKRYKVVCIAFYNFENLFDTVNTAIEVDLDKAWGESGFTREIERSALPDDAQFTDLETLNPSAQEGGIIYYDTEDEENTPTGSRMYSGEIYRHKLHQLATVVSRIGTELTPDGPAILGVAEVENRAVLEDFVRQPEIRDRNYQIVHYSSLDFRGIDVALLYNPAYFKVVASKSLPVRYFTGEDSAHVRFTRDVLWVFGELDGEPVHVFVNHWPSRRGGEAATTRYRQAAAKVNKKIIDSLTAADPTVKVIVMGDFNDDPVSPSIRDVLLARGDIEDVQPGSLYNPFYRYYKKGVGTLSWGGAWNLFDQIILSPEWLNDDTGYRFVRAAIFNPEWMVNKTDQYKGGPLRSYGGNRYLGGWSDHFPVYIFVARPVD